jgi:hypothetical protein
VGDENGRKFFTFELDTYNDHYRSTLGQMSLLSPDVLIASRHQKNHETEGSTRCRPESCSTSRSGPGRTASRQRL